MEEKQLHGANKSGKVWLRAIEDAKRQIAEHRRRIRSLRSAIATFEENLERGEPWPEEQASGSGQ